MSVQATYVLEVDWNGDGLFAHANAAITADTLSIRTRRGRDYASMLTGRASAGTLQASLYNRAGIYSPSLSTSPLYGLVLPGRKVRLRTTAPSAVTLWTGFLDRIEPAVAPGPWNSATLYASGPFTLLQQAHVNPARNSGALTGTIVSAILTAAGWSGSSVEAGQTTTGPWYVDDKQALNALREMEETEMGFLYEGLAFDVVYEDRHHRWVTAASLTSQATYSDAASPTLPYVGITELDPLREIFNVVQAEVQNYSTAALAVLWTLTGETPTLAPGESRTWWAGYPSDASGGSAGAYVDAWTTPVVGTDITQTGVANGDIGVAVSKFAQSMKITITNNNATAVATLTLLQARGTAVSKGTPTRIDASDSTSQGKYGVRTYKLPALFLANTNDAQAFASYLVSRYKDPLAVLSVTLAANRDSAAMTEALTRAISDRITVVAQNKALLGISQDAYVEAISHVIDMGKMRMMTTFDLSPASGDGAYWVLNTSALGTTTKVGY